MAVLPALAPVSDLANLVEDFDEAADTARAGLKLRQASALVREAAAQTWMTADDPPVLDVVPEVAWTITLEAAKRGFDNPRGSQSFTIDDFTDRLGDAAVTGVYLTEQETALLGKLRASGTNDFGGLQTFSTTRDIDDALLDTTWVRVAGEPDDQLFPLYPAEGPVSEWGYDR